ncbi:pre-mRNA-processing protein 45 [Coccidioides immitis RMSCC 3703]|uniref:Pre-mRNA-processing protein 45 n=1 Tax=Coccidioides immitis RMSCC 3703 TaxID=454286 RepID=A0A0J8THQ4_COCIT|nr:pre-mRNA-processing protein 45 [Coccidioides immitis RMSCC 3703]
MTSIAEGLFKSLPKPKYTGEHERPPPHAQPRGPRVVGAGSVDESQLILKQTGPPSYGKRAGWRPRAPEDFGDGGAFPEIPVAQYPLDMGRKGVSSKSNALTIQVDAEGKVKYDAIARQGHDENRIVHASFKDLIPLRQRADLGEISLDRPSKEQVQDQMEKTKAALEKLVSGAVAAQKPKNVKGGKRSEPTYVRYTPANQMGDTIQAQKRFPQPERIHCSVGFKRLAADGRGLQDVAINDKFAQFAEALFTADRHAREEVKQRAQMQQKLAEKEKAKKEEHLRQLAQKAREARAAATSGRRESRARSVSGSRSPSPYSSRSASPSEDEEAARERERMRRERRQEAERQLRQSRMGAERRIQMMAREQNRDISEKIALGLAKPTQSSESMYDSRLFNQTSGFDSGFNEDNPYDKPLFAAQNVINSIYRPRAQAEEEYDEEAGGAEMDKISRSNRFEVLGRAKEGFKGAAEAEYY